MTPVEKSVFAPSDAFVRAYPSFGISLVNRIFFMSGLIAIMNPEEKEDLLKKESLVCMMELSGKEELIRHAMKY